MIITELPNKRSVARTVIALGVKRNALELYAKVTTKRLTILAHTELGVYVMYRHEWSAVLQIVVANLNVPK